MPKKAPCTLVYIGGQGPYKTRRASIFTKVFPEDTAELCSSPQRCREELTGGHRKHPFLFSKQLSMP